VVCRTVRPKQELVRIVRRADGTVIIDPTGRQPGRGAYVCDQDACRSQAIKNGALGRALKTPLPSELREALSPGATDPIIEGGARGQE
jgi:predicted RNA-binding protein YlxR (DUF448 family)